MIQNYSDLRNAAQDFLNRADLANTVRMFIQFAEADFNRTMRARDMLSLPVTLSFNAPPPATLAPNVAMLPTDFLELRGAPWLISSGEPLAYRTPELLAQDLANPCLTGDPTSYTIVGLSMLIAPAPAAQPAAPAPPVATTDIGFFYYQRIPPLVEPTDSNWLLAKHPDLYLYNSLVQSAPYLKDDDRLQVWMSLAQKLAEDVRMDTERASFRGAAPVITPAGGSIG